jgi:hypothetical protein
MAFGLENSDSSEVVSIAMKGCCSPRVMNCAKKHDQRMGNENGLSSRMVQAFLASAKLPAILEQVLLAISDALLN